MPDQTRRDDVEPQQDATPDMWQMSMLIWGWHTDGVHPDPVMRHLEGGSADGCFDLTDADLERMELHRDGKRVAPPGWWRLLPAVIGGYDPHTAPVAA